MTWEVWSLYFKWKRWQNIWLNYEVSFKILEKHLLEYNKQLQYLASNHAYKKGCSKCRQYTFYLTIITSAQLEIGNHRCLDSLSIYISYFWHSYTPRPYLTFIAGTDYSVLTVWQQCRPMGAVWLQPNGPEFRCSLRVSPALLR